MARPWTRPICTTWGMGSTGPAAFATLPTRPRLRISILDLRETSDGEFRYGITKLEPGNAGLRQVPQQSSRRLLHLLGSGPLQNISRGKPRRGRRILGDRHGDDPQRLFLAGAS